MDLKAPFRIKTCCFCLKLRTGCYIIGVFYLLFAVLLTLEEIYQAIFFYKFKTNNKVLGVVFMYDMIPLITLVFSVCFIYGIYKDDKVFIYCGTSLTIFLLASNIFSIVFRFFSIIFRWWIYFYVMHVLESIIIAGVLTVFLIVILSYYHQVNDRMSKMNNVDQPHELVNEEC